MDWLTKSIKENYKPIQMAKKGTYQRIEAWASKQSHTIRWVFLENSLIYRLEVVKAL